MYTFDILTPADTPLFRHLTVPIYQSRVDAAGVDPWSIAIGVSLFGRPVGLLLGSLEPATKLGIVQSIVVTPEYRGAGLGTELLRRGETLFRERGCEKAMLDYVAGKPLTPAVERLLRAREWEPPQARLLVVEATCESISQAPWYAWKTLPPGFSIIPWSDVTASDRQDMKRRPQEDPWIPEALDPSFWEQDFEPTSSLGLRYHGKFVGWMINHRVDDKILRYSTGWVRPDLQRVGHYTPMIPLLIESITRAAAAGFPGGVWFVSPQQAPMHRFARRWMVKYATFVGEAMRATKKLELAPADDARVATLEPSGTLAASWHE